MARNSPQTTASQAEVYARHAEMDQVHPQQILNTLRDKEMSVSDMASRLRVAVGNLSQHLNMMKQRHVLVTRKDGNIVYYRLADSKILVAFDLIREILFEQMQREGTIVRQMKSTRARG
jgi:ArsR family transcriptional regulator